MKTKDRGLAQTLFVNVCDAPKAQFGQFMTNLSLWYIADPTRRGLRQPELAGQKQDFDGTKRECL
jgi:hypothetical protein